MLALLPWLALVEQSDLLQVRLICGLLGNLAWISLPCLMNAAYEVDWSN